MFISSWFPWRLARQYKGRARPAHAPAFRRRTRLACEQLEDRTVPSSVTAATVSDLIADINAANLAGGSNTITLAPGKTFTLTAVDNTNWGPTGLPVIAANDNLTIQGNGDTIVRSATGPAFRLFDVASGATLTLEDLTLQGGLASANGAAGGADGGAIYSAGALTLSAVTVTGNSAMGSATEPAQGGGIYSVAASLALEAGTVITNNSALGSNTGPGYGGGVYVAGGTATLTGVTLSSNTAQGGDYGWYGDWGGAGFGGALFVGYTFRTPATVTLSNCSLLSNAAVGGKGTTHLYAGGSAEGGAVYVTGQASVTMTSDTLSSNSALGGVGPRPSAALGGAVYVSASAPSTVTLRGCTISGNSAQARGKDVAEGGGIFVESGRNAGSVYLDAFTLANTTGNTPDNIYGWYALIT
jgi:hypothetical protein